MEVAIQVDRERQCSRDLAFGVENDDRGERYSMQVDQQCLDVVRELLGRDGVAIRPPRLLDKAHDVGIPADDEDGAHLKIVFTLMNGVLLWSPSFGSRAR